MHPIADTEEHVTRIRQLAGWMTGQRWTDEDALLAMAAVQGMMFKGMPEARALLALCHSYAARIAEVSANGGGQPEKDPPPGADPDNGPPVAAASTKPLPVAKISGTVFGDDVRIS